MNYSQRLDRLERASKNLRHDVSPGHLVDDLNRNYVIPIIALTRALDYIATDMI